MFATIGFFKFFCYIVVVASFCFKFQMFFGFIFWLEELVIEGHLVQTLFSYQKSLACKILGVNEYNLYIIIIYIYPVSRR